MVEITKATEKMLSVVFESINAGKKPIIILPDTTMRIYGVLFQIALRTAFPKLFGRGKLPIVFFVVPLKGSMEIRNLPPELIKILKTTENLDILVFDDASPVGETMKSITKKFQEYNSIIKPQLILQMRAFFDIQTDIDKYQYIGKGRSSLPKTKPELVVATRDDYKQNGVEHFFRQQTLARQQLYQLGIQVGQRYRAQLEAQQKR
jgi:hypothetical protein